MKKSIFLNYAYGYGPFLRAFDIAASVNNILDHMGLEKLQIIAPLVYDKRQVKIASEVYSSHNVKFDIRTGNILKKIFYDGSDYKENIKNITKNYYQIERDFDKELIRLMAENNIVAEINRNPRISTRIPLKFSSVMGLFSSFLERSIKDGFLKKKHGLECIDIAEHIESSQYRIFLSEPISMSDNSSIKCPPIVGQYNEDRAKIAKGIYFYHSGIKNIRYKKINFNGINVYHSSDHNVSLQYNPNIMATFARAGWGMLSQGIVFEKPMVIFPYCSDDDPEIYYNIEVLKKLDLVAIYDSNKTIYDNVEIAQSKVANMKKFKRHLIKKYKTLDGAMFCADNIFSCLQSEGVI